MEHRTFFEHYRISTGYDRAPQEISRTGPAIHYKAIDTRSNEPVVLQLIPIAGVDQARREQFEESARTAQKLDHVNIAKVLHVGTEYDHLGLVSEYLEGETADSWVVAHGPMGSDAVVRAGLQVVRAIGAAAFFNFTHRTIQPSNLMIVPGQAPDGGWPFVKVLNFGIAGLELHSESTEGRKLAPTPSAQFASPEQLLNREIDFPSEMYSLGATMCFLLTGAVPLDVSGMKARLRIQRLPELRHVPKALRNLLAHMLREKPENRPQDPVAFESEMRECLTKIERRQAFRRKLGIPLAATIPKKPKQPKEPSSPLAQVFRGVVAVAVLLLAAAAVADLFFPDKIPFLRSPGNLGVRVGVPNAQAFASAPAPVTNAVSNTGKQLQNNASPAIADANPQPSPSVQQTTASNADASARTNSANPSISPQIASGPRAVEPAPPAAGPDEESSGTENADQSTQSNESSARNKGKTTSPTADRTWTSKNWRITRAAPRDNESDRTPVHRNEPRSRVIGMTPDGRMILRLRSGRVIIVNPRYDEDVWQSQQRRRYVPPYQPYYPQGYPSND